MNRILLTLLMISLSSVSVAQTSGRPNPIKFGIKAGINSESMTLTPTKGSMSDYNISPNERIGYHFGIYSRINLIIFSLQPELLYSVSSFKLKSVSRHDENDVVNSTVRLKNIELPVLASFRFLFLRLNAGPVFNLMNQTRVAQSSKSVDVATIKPTVGFALGVGFSLRDIDFDLRYRGEFSKTSHSIKVADSKATDFRGKFNGWSLSLGYIF